MNAWKRSNRAGVYARQKETAPKGGWMGAEILNRFEQPYYADRCDPFIIVLPPGKRTSFFWMGRNVLAFLLYILQVPCQKMISPALVQHKD